VHPADGCEQRQVVPERAVPPRQVEEHGRAGVLDLVDRVAQPGHEPAGAPGPGDDRLGHGVPARVVVRAGPMVDAGQRAGQEAGGVLGHAQEPRPAAEEPGRDGALQRLGRAGVGQARRDGRGREPVVGQRDEHGVEHGELAGRRPPLGDEPERQLAEPDLPDQLAGQVVAEQQDRVGRRGADAGPERLVAVGGDAARGVVDRAHAVTPRLARGGRCAASP
jgi:hypothetical protein